MFVFENDFICLSFCFICLYFLEIILFVSVFALFNYAFGNNFICFSFLEMILFVFLEVILFVCGFLGMVLFVWCCTTTSERSPVDIFVI